MSNKRNQSARKSSVTSATSASARRTVAHRPPRAAPGTGPAPAAPEGGAPGFDAIQEAVTGYLKAEQELGRVAETVDPEAAELAIVGAAHHLLMTSGRAHPTHGLPSHAW